MAQIIITTTKEEQDKVVDALKDCGSTKVAVAVVATKAGINPNRVRYILADLIEAGRVRRTIVKAFNKHYIRYSYEIVEEAADGN